MTVMNILLQGLYSWELIKNLPPGSGSVPKIGKLMAIIHMNNIWLYLLGLENM